MTENPRFRSNRVEPTRSSLRVIDSANESRPSVDFDLRAIFSTFWRGKWIVGISALIGVVIAFLLVSQQTPVYRAAVKVMFGVQQANVINLSDVLTEQGADSGRLEDQIQILSSSSLISRVVDRLELDRKPLFNPLLRPPERTWSQRVMEFITLPPELEKVLGVNEPKQVRQVEDLSQQELQRLRLIVVESVRSGLRLTPIGKSRVIQISYISVDPQLSADIANTVAEQYIVDQLEAKLQATRSATDWLTTRVQELRDQLQRDEQTLQSTRSTIAQEAGQSLDIVQQQLSALNANLATQRSDVTRLQALYDRLALALKDGSDLGAISEFRTSGVVQNLRSQISNIRSEIAALPDTLPEQHPARLGMNEQLSRVQAEVIEEAARIVQAAEIDLNAAIAQEQSLIKQVSELEQRTQDLSESEVRLRQLEREVESSRALYQTFFGRLQETTEQIDLQEADARILSPAEPPLSAETQSRRRALLAVVGLFTLMGIGLVYLLEYLNNTFRSPDQLERETGTRVLGVIPTDSYSKTRRDLIYTFLGHPASSISEAVRNLRTSILFSDIDNPPKVVMFTSSVPNEAKSSTAMLTALTSKQMGKSAILIDCDLRLPSLAGVFNPPKGHPDLLAVLDGSATLDEAIFQEPESGLHALLSGYRDINHSVSPADVLSSAKFGQLLEELGKRYDLVILDTPPVLIVTDARVVSRHADAVVYTVRWDETPRNAVKEGLKELEAIGAPVIGTVMTMVNEARASRYAYEGYNYYRGQYRGYYSE